MIDMCGNVRDTIFNLCVTTVLIVFMSTMYYESIKETETEKEIAMEAIKNGYIECLETYKGVSIAKKLWKKECSKNNVTD